MTHVLTGADRAALDPDLIGGSRIGLLTNYTGTVADLTRTSGALLSAGVPVTTIFGPEHGVNGSVQAGETEGLQQDQTTGLPVVETYLKEGSELDELIASSGVDTLVFDMQDLGARTFTYVSSMYDAIESAARLGIRFVVLDRPNPLGGVITCGPGLEPGFTSFVGRVDLPQRHGLTAGEIARLISTRDLPAMGLSVDLDVVTMDGWDPSQDFEATGLQWVQPGPNIPTIDTAFAFCGTVLFEATNFSEGRGTTRPFERIGAPYVDGELAARLRRAGLPGVIFREVWFVPSFHKYAGSAVRGAQAHITDRRAFDPVRTALTVIAILADLYPEHFRFTGQDGQPFIDLLWGSDSLRRTVETAGDIIGLAPQQAPTTGFYGDEVLLYPRRRH